MLCVTHAGPEELLGALTAGMEPEKAERIQASMRAAREDRARREAAFKAAHRLRIREVMRTSDDCAHEARRLARLVRLRLLPNDLELIAERAFPMSAPDRARLVERLRELGL